MKKRLQKKREKKGLKTPVVKKDLTSIGTLGQIGVPGAVVDSPINTLPGSPFSTPQTTVSNWPAPNLWYAQGRDAAKQVYHQYLNVLNQYTNCPSDQPDRKLQLAGQMNSLIVSTIQGVTIGLEAEEAAARRSRMGDRAGQIEQEVISDTLDKMLKMIWIHDTAAHSQQFAGLEEKLIEASITGRLKRVNPDYNVSDVGIPLLTADEANLLWVDEPLQPPIDAPADEMQVPPEQTPVQTESSDIIPDDQAPPPENEAANEFVPNPNDNLAPSEESEQDTIEVADDIPAEEQPANDTIELADEEEPTMTAPNEETQLAPPVESEVAETPEIDEGNDLREQISAIIHDIWARWVLHLFASGETNEDGSMTIPALDVARWQRQMPAAYDELSEEEKEKDRELADKILAVLGEEEAEEPPTEEVAQEVEGTPQIATFDQLKEEAPVEVPVEDTGEEVPIEEAAETPIEAEGEEAVTEVPAEEATEEEEPPEEITDTETATEETPEGDTTIEETEELPDEGETVYCIECDRDVTPEEIDACENERCPYKQVTEEEEEVVEPETKGEESNDDEEDDTENKHHIMIDHKDGIDHCTCKTYIVNFPDFDGAQCEFCLDHKKALAYTFEKKTWKREDATAWIRKQNAVRAIKNKSAKEIVEQKIDEAGHTILKGWLDDEKLPAPEGLEIDGDVFGEALDNVLSSRLGEALEPIKQRLGRLEA